MSTARQVMIQQAEFENRMRAWSERIACEVIAPAIARILDARVPCIKYGRGKRRYRLAIPRGSRLLPAPEIVF